MAKVKYRFSEIDLSKPLLSDAECQVVTGFSKSTQRRLAMSGGFPAKVALTPRIKGRPTQDVLEYLKARGVRIEVA
jgi:predicted DNA-binding transcriptional regulator AlpA